MFIRIYLFIYEFLRVNTHDRGEEYYKNETKKTEKLITLITKKKKNTFEIHIKVCKFHDNL